MKSKRATKHRCGCMSKRGVKWSRTGAKRGLKNGGMVKHRKRVV